MKLEKNYNNDRSEDNNRAAAIYLEMQKGNCEHFLEFEEICKKWNLSMYNEELKLWGEDFYSSVKVLLYRDRMNFDEEKGSFFTWYDLKVKEVKRDMVREGERKAEEVFSVRINEEGEECDIMESIPSGVDMEQDMINKGYTHAILEEIAGYRTNYINVIILCMICGYKEKEAAEFLGVSTETIYNWKIRAKRKLLKSIERKKKEKDPREIMLQRKMAEKELGLE